MGFSSNTLKDLALCLVKFMLAMALLSWIPIFKKLYNEPEQDTGDDESRPSPSLVQVPLHLIVESIKERMPAMKYGYFKKGELGSACAICLKCMSESDEVRNQSNCCHVFHRECLDGWLDQGQATCPLCRSKFLPIEESKCGGDPWRRERMIYLFGEDCAY